MGRQPFIRGEMRVIFVIPQLGLIKGVGEEAKEEFLLR